MSIMLDIYRIDLSSSEIRKESIHKGHPLEFYAGRSLSSKIISDEVSPEIDPLNSNNKLIFASGFLGGTSVPNSGRISIGAKSPLTWGIKEANVGGRAPALLSTQGIRALIFEGISPKCVIIKVSNGQPEIIDAGKFCGLNNYDLSKKILEEFGPKVGAFMIGRAGEQLFSTATIASIDLQGYPSRHAARGGLGAVMGSKNVKAVVILPPTKTSTKINENENKISSKALSETTNPEYYDKTSFMNITKEWFKELHDTKQTFSKFGTALGVGPMSETHGLPTQNFRRGSFKNVEKISGDALHEYIIKNKGKFSVSCSPGCAIQCSNIVLSPSGEHITSSLEYETIALNGSNLLIDDIEKIAWLDHYSDDVGIDSIEIGNELAIFMEAGKLQWGDADGAIRLIYGINDGNPDSILLGLGCYELGKKLGVSRIAHVKKQGFPGYDPRAYKAMGVTFLTSPMGADHTSGAAINNRKAYAEKDYGNLTDPDQKILLSKELQIFTMLLDSMGMCYFVGPSYESAVRLSKLLYFKYGLGWEKTAEDWIDWAWKCLKMEHDYNVKAGIKDGDFSLPSFMQTEKLEEIDYKWDVKSEDMDSFWKK